MRRVESQELENHSAQRLAESEPHATEKKKQAKGHSAEREEEAEDLRPFLSCVTRRFKNLTMTRFQLCDLRSLDLPIATLVLEIDERHRASRNLLGFRFISIPSHPRGS